MIDIGWLNTYDSIEYQKLSNSISIPSFVVFEPERYIRKPENTGNRFIFTNCPAYQQFNRNIYVIRSPIDISLSLVQTSAGGYEYACRPVDDKVSPAVLQSIIEFNPDPNSRADFANPVIQIKLPYVFFADVPVTIQQFPAIYEMKKIPGNFIVHTDPSKKIQLVRLKASDDLIKPIVRAQGSANLGIKTFDLFEVARKWRKPKYITNKNIWKPGD